MNSLEEIALKVAKETDAHLGECVSRDSAIWAYENARRLVAALGAQEPMAWKDTVRTEHADGRTEDAPVLLGYEGWESLPDAADLFAAPVLPSVKEVTDAMITAYLKANDTYWDETDALAPPTDKWRTGTPREATRVSLEAALLSAAPSPQEDAK